MLLVCHDDSSAAIVLSGAHTAMQVASESIIVVTMIPASISILDVKYSVNYLRVHCFTLYPCTGTSLPGVARGWEVILGNSD